MKRVLVIMLVLLMILSLVGCLHGTAYFGPHLDLQIVAMHSLLGVGETTRWDGFEVLEEDDFGRAMFAFWGGAMTGGNNPFASFNILAVLISQRTTESHAYFYDGINFILRQVESDETRRPSSSFAGAFVMEYFTEGQLEQLKEENDWNRELDEDKFFRVPISRRAKGYYMTDISLQMLEGAFAIVSEGFNRNLQSLLTMDRNGNVIFIMRGGSFNSRASEWTFYSSFLFMFDRDGNLIEGTGVKELTDLWDYREELLEFKKANGWSFSYR